MIAKLETKRNPQSAKLRVRLLAGIVIFDLVLAPNAQTIPLPISRLTTMAAFEHASVQRHIRLQDQYDELISQAAKLNRIDPLLIKAIMWAESEGNPRSLSKTGARGLMQLQPRTARHLGVKDSFNPAENIYAGTRHFKGMLTLFHGNLLFALAAYNAGEGPVRRYHGIPPFRETQHYVRHVMRTYRRYQQEAGLRPATLPSFSAQVATIKKKSIARSSKIKPVHHKTTTRKNKRTI